MSAITEQFNWQYASTEAAAESDWDVTIVGAGPAGATAAIHLARRGHRTLLLDKDAFPRDKVCGDALIADAIRALRRAGLYESVCVLGFKTALSTVYSPARVHFDVHGEFLTLKRFALDALIAREAVASGAIFCRSKVTSVEARPDNSVMIKVSGSANPIRSRIVFLATGANVDIAADLGLITRPGPSAVALRCYARSDVSVDRLIISYDRSIAPGYAWIFPLSGGEFNIGCGITYDETNSARVNLREIFRVFVEGFPVAREIMRTAHSISPLRGARLRCGLDGARPAGGDNILVIGESIGATFPFTGEGIGKAMETGELAAEVAHNALINEDFERLKEFPARLESELKPKFFGYQIAQDWFSKPWLTDFVARRIRRSRFLQESMAGIVNETVDPREIFSARGILRSFVS